MKKPMTYEEITELHQELNGKCQKCGQKCRARVVSFVTGEADSLQMVCPDCKQGKERPFFTASTRAIDLVSERAEWDKEIVSQYLQVFPLGMILINHNEHSREYVNNDKTKYIKLLETDHEGNYLNVVAHPAKKAHTIKADGVVYPVNEKTSVGFKRIYIPGEIEDTHNIDEKVAYRIEQYKKYGEFTKPILVTRGGKSKSKPFTIIDGYSMYLASKEMGITNVPVYILGNPFK